MVKAKMIEYTLKGPLSQERARIRLMSALRENRFPQSILIDGPAGIGKKALALEIAKALQCENSENRPCGHCFGCNMANDSGATDKWVLPLDSEEARAKSGEEASARSTAKTIEDIKKEYIQEIQKNPYRVDVFSSGAFISASLIRSMTSNFALKGDRVRTVIIAEADLMNEAASNAFLKTLEDVPKDTYFILTTTTRERLLQTIRSRCLSLHLLPLTDNEVRSEVAKYMGENFSAEDLSDDIVGIAEGSPGKALYYLEKGSDWFKLAATFVQKSIRGDYTDLFLQLKKINLKEPQLATHFLEVLSFLIADLLRKIGGAPLRMPETSNLVNLDMFPRIDAQALELALVGTQETVYRLESKRMSVEMALQDLAIKLFEGYK